MTAPVRVRLTNPVTGTVRVPVRTGQSAGGSRSL